MERVSKELAIELKAAGYDVPSNENYFEGKDESRYAQDGEYVNHNKIDVTMSAPYLDEVIDWLDTKGIFVDTLTLGDKSFKASVWDSREIAQTGINYGVFSTSSEHSRTSAKIAGISKALEPIKNQDHGK